MRKEAILAGLFSILVAQSFAGEVNSVPARVKLTAKLMEGGKELISTEMHTLDGQPSPVGVGNVLPYMASAHTEGGKVVIKQETVWDGVFMSFTPSLSKDGKIDVAFDVRQSASPTGNAIESKQHITLDDGKEASIPVGKIHATSHEQYVLKIVASKDED